MGKQSLKNYKKQAKQDVSDKRVFQQNIISKGNEIINEFKCEFDEALLHCLDRKLDDDIFNYIYDCQLEHNKDINKKMEKIKRRIDHCASDVAIDFQIYSEERYLGLARHVSGSDISDLVMHIAKRKLFNRVLENDSENDSENNEHEKVSRTKIKHDDDSSEKWTVLAIKLDGIYKPVSSDYLKAVQKLQSWYRKYK